MADILGKIKSVDGRDALPQALVEQYGLSYEEATVWERHLWLVWSGLEAEFILRGESEELRALVGALKSNPDNQTYLEGASVRHAAAFLDHLDRVQALAPPGR